MNNDIKVFGIAGWSGSGKTTLSRILAESTRSYFEEVSAVTSGVADAGGEGTFEYDPSSGTFDGSSKDFRALCTNNLATYGNFHFLQLTIVRHAATLEDGNFDLSAACFRCKRQKLFQRDSPRLTGSIMAATGLTEKVWPYQLQQPGHALLRLFPFYLTT